MAIKMNLKISMYLLHLYLLLLYLFSLLLIHFLHMNINGLIWLLGIFISQLIAHLLRGSAINTMPDIMHPWIVERPTKPEELPAHDLCEIFEPMYESTRATNIIDTHTLFHSLHLYI